MASTSHIERTADEPRHSELHEGVIVSILDVNDRIRLFRFELQSGPVKVHDFAITTPSHFSPGQWLDTYVPSVSKPGGFTITSAPSAAASESRPYVELAVARAPENAVAAWLWRPTDRVLGSAVRLRIGGSFVFPPLDSRLGNVGGLVFVAGGVGINPLVSMLRFVAEMESALDIDVRVLYASKLPASGRLQDILFLSEIAALFGQRKLRGWLRLYATGAGNGLVVDEGSSHVGGAPVDVGSGRLTSDEARRVVRELDPAKTLVYICGPPLMTDELFAALTESGQEGSLKPDRVLTEKWW
ncbi:hypothetical protein CDD80_3871 [Ophiocordyceps camponoti-rufipedis]|uniref:Oxidoreductase NAD-binding domain-containing protein 1 n=1 Tax=Ophiocordyceps camponoti-rufipedis TaxID=2004952 RepID=A0A2C5ZKG5_9HYPO|nr:hypothetical protein CDD80_3871 [Ophiocordyceps camponoti-rufipedis]